jgi:hypothetical protein
VARDQHFLTRELEKSKVIFVGNCDMRSRKMIWFVGSRGHVARDQHFADSRAGEVKGDSCRNSRYAKS